MAKSVTKKVYLGMDSTLEGFEDAFSGVKSLSLDRFNSNLNTYERFPFLNEVQELKVKTS